MSWMMEIGLSDTIAHLCWQGEGEAKMMEGRGRGSCGGEASVPLSLERDSDKKILRKHATPSMFSPGCLTSELITLPNAAAVLLFPPWAPWLTVHLVFWLTRSHCLWPCVKLTADGPSELSSVSQGEALERGCFSVRVKRPGGGGGDSLTWGLQVSICSGAALRRRTSAI